MTWEAIAENVRETPTPDDIYSTFRYDHFGNWRGKVTMDWQRVRRAVPQAMDATVAAAFSTEPVDRDAVMRGVERLYKGFDKKTVPPVVFFDSPLQALLATAMSPVTSLYNQRIVAHDDNRWGSTTWNVPTAWSRGKLPYDRSNVPLFQNITRNPRRMLNDAIYEAALQDHRQATLVHATASDMELYSRKAYLAMQSQLPANHPYLNVKPHAEQVFRSRINRMNGGQLDIGELGIYSLAFALGMKFTATPAAHRKILQGLLDLTSAGPWWAFNQAFYVSDRFLESRRREGLPHSEDWLDTPAFLFRDGWAIFAREGMLLPRQIIEDPTSLTVQRIRRERNAEMRRVLIEFMGYERFLEESRARLLLRDEYGKLWLIPNEEFRVVEVENSTPEPDGTIRHYFLRVPRTVQTPHAAVAWTFDLPVNEYNPIKQT